MPSIKTVRSVIYPNEIDRILKKPGGPVGVEVRRACLAIADEGEQIARRELGNRHPADAPRTGRYARSFAVKVETDPVAGFAYRVENTAAYAAVLELGARPHEIKARRARFLRFRSRKTGQWVTVKAVNHPGLPKGYAILQRALLTAGARFGWLRR